MNQHARNEEALKHSITIEPPSVSEFQGTLFQKGRNGLSNADKVRLENIINTDETPINRDEEEEGYAGGDR